MLQTRRRPRRGVRFSRQELALVAVTAVWGTTFLIVHLAVQHGGPLLFVGLRFLAAGAISALVFRRTLSGLTRRELGAGTAIGVTIFGGYALQTVGLQTIPSSTSAFLTALYVPLVPLLQWAAFHRAPKPAAWAGVALAFTGLLLLADPGSAGLTLSTGEVLTLVSTIAIAAEIVLIGLFAGTVDLGRVTVVQLLVGGALSVAMMPVVGEGVPSFSWIWLAAAIGLGAASCLIQITMNWAQQSVSPTRATVIYAGEPVWGGIIGRLAGDRLPGLAIVGAALIVAGVLVSELKLRARPGRDPDGASAACLNPGALTNCLHPGEDVRRKRRPQDSGAGLSREAPGPGSTSAGAQPGPRREQRAAVELD